MIKRRRFRTDAAARVARKNNLSRRAPHAAPERLRPSEEGTRRSLPDQAVWAEPLDEEDRRALKAGWGFVE